MHFTITESMLAIMLAIGFLTAAVFAIACYRPFGVRGDPLDSFLIVAALILIGTSGGFGVAYVARGGPEGLGTYGPAFLVCILSALVFTAIFALRRRSQEREERSKGGPE
ncbi:hypothetical protein LPW11_01740 [Geomonas sp. RF6]|uniref:hypothetical protein n=1 Tax=Geomonas sp. RF6 TaxID=2897342 RepID=UPI001E4E12B9|nr:hypothetical protein [Geomonas sp. RF6]UFS70918.1 hypothetical protein LPW11_01740 [Geomonas sp. RF6]